MCMCVHRCVRVRTDVCTCACSGRWSGGKVNMQQPRHKTNFEVMYKCCLIRLFS